MRYSKISGALVFALSLLLTVSAFARDKTASMELQNAAQISGKRLPAGSYELKWKGKGREVQVQFTQGRKVLATTPAKLVDVSSEYDQDAAVIETAGGSRDLIEAHFAGRKYKLVFPSAAAQAQAMHAGSSSESSNP